MVADLRRRDAGQGVVHDPHAQDARNQEVRVAHVPGRDGLGPRRRSDPWKITVIIDSVVTDDGTMAGPSLRTAQSWTLHDAACLTGIRPGAPDAASATGTFRLFSDSACTNQLYAETVSVVGGTASTTTAYTTSTPGTYYWTAYCNRPQDARA